MKMMLIAMNNLNQNNYFGIETMKVNDLIFTTKKLLLN
jgi:hypothetical protein